MNVLLTATLAKLLVIFCKKKLNAYIIMNVNVHINIPIHRI